MTKWYFMLTSMERRRVSVFREAAIQEKVERKKTSLIPHQTHLSNSQTESRPRVLRDTILADQDNAPEVEGGTTS